ncbi:MAG: S8 family serine peptidase [Planctomycetaceae bacterium]|nr:S8 family serine peptidase [Planctomycetaceae bacterium]
MRSVALALLSLPLLAFSVSAAEPTLPVDFEHAGVTAAWSAYGDRLTFGSGQTLALLDDGCDLSKPEWSNSDGDIPKVLVTYDAVDGDDDPKHEGRGYHGTTIGVPSSINFGGKQGVAFNDQLAVVRSLECCHCNVSDGVPLARALQWVIENHEQYRITTINLAPVDDQAHAEPVATDIDDKLVKLHELGIWVSAPTGNHNFTDGISWPASQPHCFAIGAVVPGQDVVHQDRHAKVVLAVPGSATSSSNALVCGAAIILREAISQTGYDWRPHGPTLPDAMLALMQETGVPVHDPGTGLTFRRLDLKAALDRIYAGN